jgi:hypothetical protein
MRMQMDDMPFHKSIFTEKAPIKIWGTEMGGMLIAKHDFYPDCDVTPLLKGLPDDLCPVQHWGYCFSGELTIKYKDKEEVVRAGDVFWWEPGHTFITAKDADGPCSILEFSIAKEFMGYEEGLNHSAGVE